MMKKLIVAFIILNILFSFNSVYIFAQTETGAGFCLWDKESGEYCSDVIDGSNCERFVRGLSCEKRLDKCSRGVCIGADTCNDAVSRVECEDSKGTYRTGSSASIPECKSGGCVLGKECLYTTLLNCNKQSGRINQKVSFDATMSREQCGLYFSGSQTGAGQQPLTQQSKDCVQGGTFETSYYNYRGLETLTKGVTIDIGMLGNAGSRSNGESWCVKDGEGKNPGDRYYIYFCKNGEIAVNECGVFRDTVCQESRKVIGGRFVNTAKCVPNENTKEVPIGGYFYKDRNVNYGAGGVDPFVECGKCGQRGSMRGWFDRCGGDECRAIGDCSYRSAGPKDRFKSAFQVGIAAAVAVGGFQFLTGFGAGGVGEPAFGLPFTKGGVFGEAATGAGGAGAVDGAGARGGSVALIKGIAKGVIVSIASQEVIQLLDSEGKPIPGTELLPKEGVEVVESAKAGDAMVRVRDLGTKQDGYVPSENIKTQE